MTTFPIQVDDTGEFDGVILAAAVGEIRRHKGRRVIVEVRESTRTLEQNKAVHELIQQITTAMRDKGVTHPMTGDPYSFGTWREYFFDKHCPRESLDIPKGRTVETISKRKSTTDMTIKELTKLIDDIRTDEVLLSRGVYVELKRG